MKRLMAIVMLVLSTTLWAQEMVKGTVLKTIDVDNYTYVEVKTEKGPIWAAVMKTPLKVGAPITVSGGMMMEKFESKGLKKTFDKIYFGEIEGASASKKVAPTPMNVKVEKATTENAKSVAELYKDRTALKGKSVTIKGKVVKFNAGIMGKNWVHLQDGTGKTETKDFDITVTTNDNFKVGDVVTISGTVTVDKDFGAGYFFPIIIEEAKKL